jgi:hypothetical protein
MRRGVKSIILMMYHANLIIIRILIRKSQNIIRKIIIIMLIRV